MNFIGVILLSTIVVSLIILTIVVEVGLKHIKKD